LVDLIRSRFWCGNFCKRKRPALGWPFLKVRNRLGSLYDESLNAGVETALVTAGGVLVQDTLLDALVEDRSGGAVRFKRLGVIAGGDGLAQKTQGAAKLGLVGAVDGRLGDGLTSALQGRDMICHSKTLFFNPGFVAVRGGKLGCRPAGW